MISCALQLPNSGYAPGTAFSPPLQALYWLSLKALGEGGTLSAAELAMPPATGDGVGGGTGHADDGSCGDENAAGATSTLREPHSSSDTVPVTCAPGEEVVLGYGITGPVYAGR